MTKFKCKNKNKTNFIRIVNDLDHQNETDNIITIKISVVPP